MKVDLLVSDPLHPIIPYLEKLISKNNGLHEFQIVNQKTELQGASVLFLVSCQEFIEKKIREMYGACLVLHASELPLGRGWSPHIWSVIEGATELTVSLISAEDSVDTGALWLQSKISIEDHFLYDEINERLFEMETHLIQTAVDNFDQITPYPQDENINPTYRQRRTPDMSELDPNESLSKQFDLIRVCDPARYPAYFKLRGQTYQLKITKSTNEID